MITSDLIVILAPTASGKTSLSIELAKHIDGEIVSSDSMQVYKGLQICTAQPTIEEMDGIPHHLIGYVDPKHNYSVGEYQAEALECIADIHKRGKTPILCGGSGLYIDSVIYNMDLASTPSNKEVRNKYTSYYKEHGVDKLYKLLVDAIPETAKRIHPNNINRVVRALEIYELTGKGIDEYYNENMKQYRFNTYLFGITWDREILYDRINKRVDIMLENGLIDEIINMKDYGVKEGNTAYKAIGFKELTPYLDGNVALDEAIDKMKQHSRNYAKRQVTWFKRVDNVKWLEHTNNYNKLQEISKILHYIENINF